VAQGDSVLPGAGGRRVRRLGPWSFSTTARRSRVSTRDWKKRQAFSRLFRPFRTCPRRGFFDQVIGTALLLLLIFAIGDERNLPPQANLAPLVVGLIVVAIGVSFGKLHGYAIQPRARFRAAPADGARRLQE